MTDMELGEIFRDNVRRLLSEEQISPSALARKMHVSPQYVNSYLSPTRPSDPGLGVLSRFAEALDCEPWELIQPEKIPA